MIWLPQIPHFMMTFQPPFTLIVTSFETSTPLAAASSCCRPLALVPAGTCRFTETVGPCLHAMSKGSVAAMCLLAPRPARLWPRNAEEEFTDDMRAREFCCRA